MTKNIGNLTRALRLPFTSASVLPFIFGSLLARPNFAPGTFFLGLLAALSTHLSANLINDYADSRTGADWQDRRFFKFFGGSKLIQQGVFSERFYLNLAIFFAALAAVCVSCLAKILNSSSILGYFFLILFLGWAYSMKPLQLAYHRLGEIVIFLLFGPALVMGGFFIQTRVFPTLPGFILSVPFGLLTVAILFSNEVPDFTEDKTINKLTWVSIIGAHRAYILYLVLIALAYLAIAYSVYIGYLGRISLLAFALVIPALKAAAILKKNFADKQKLVNSSKLTIGVQTMVSLVLILDLLI